MLKEQRTKGLIISAVGDKSLHKHWGRTRFDTCLIFYGDGLGYKEESKYYFQRKGCKYHLIKDVLKENPALLEEYDYFWLPDDDVLLEQDQVASLFEYMRIFDLALAQPAIVGYYSLSITLPWPDSRLRFTNFVEIMCPCFSRDALKMCVDHFDENKTGWSYDALWNELLDHPKRSIAIIDDIVGVHTRPVFGGNLYQNNSMAQDSAMAEGKALFAKYSLAHRRVEDLAHGTPHITHNYATVVYDCIPKSNEEANKLRNERLWPPVQFWNNSIEQLWK